MRKNIYILCLSALMAAVFASCGDEMLPVWQDDANKEMVQMTLNLSVTDVQTRGIDDPDHATNHALDGIDSKIHNVWVLQFDGTSDDATITGTPQYIKAEAGETLNGTSPTVELVASENDEMSTIVVIANTFDEDFAEKYITQNLSLGKLKQQPRLIFDQRSALVKSGDLSGTDFPEDGNYHLLMNCMKTQKVSNGGSIDCPMKRNMSRVDIKLNVLKSTGLEIKKFVLKSVPAKEFYLTDYDLDEQFPRKGSFQTVEFEYDVWNKSEDKGTSTEYNLRYYTAPNMRGTETRNTSERYKNWYAPADATYLEVQTTYKDDGVDVPRTYTFYLGENMFDDYNLKPNHKYAYTFNINTLGDDKFDSRVEDFGIVDFTKTAELSNCYIINPPEIAGYMRKFRIPITRVNDFWGNKGYENVPANCITQKDHWEAYVVWMDESLHGVDADGMEKFNITVGEGYGMETEDGKPTFIEVEVPRGAEGNVVIGIRMTEPVSPCLWSWHLWVTDYDPDGRDDIVIDHDHEQYTYNVKGGLVHRLDGASWKKNGDYENAIMMDRNLGTHTSKHYTYNRFDGVENVKIGGVVYQYGRKDPFTMEQNYYNENGKLVTSGNYPSKSRETLTPEDLIPQMVYFPGTYFGRTKDLTGSKYHPKPYTGDIIWFDPHVTKSEYPKSGKKSIFDPAPLGWITPKSGVFDCLVNTTQQNINSATSRRGLPIFSSLPGKEYYDGQAYWPYVDPWKEKVPDVVIYFPNDGGRKWDTNNLFYHEVSFVHADPRGAELAYEYITSATSPRYQNYNMSYSLHIRPVKLLKH